MYNLKAKLSTALAVDGMILCIVYSVSMMIMCIEWIKWS